ncbi:MAG: hypothetical protein P1U88_17555 [Thalassobaculaceae bacterium]|nr:hypothetical protein [Thalassobaculaceae bacterium]
MNATPTEIYRPRAVAMHGIQRVGSIEIKVYGLCADGQTITDEMMSTSQRFLEAEVLPRATATGGSNGLGFVIIHPGELGLSISAHWWIQGCVLCQHFFRQAYGAQQPVAANSRPVIGCVWELALINAEQQAWRETMMSGEPDRTAYLSARPSFTEA